MAGNLLIPHHLSVQIGPAHCLVGETSLIDQNDIWYNQLGMIISISYPALIVSSDEVAM